MTSLVSCLLEIASFIDPLLFDAAKIVFGGSGVIDLDGESEMTCAIEAEDNGDCVGGGGDSDKFDNELLSVLVPELV